MSMGNYSIRDSATVRLLCSDEQKLKPNAVMNEKLSEAIKLVKHTKSEAAKQQKNSQKDQNKFNNNGNKNNNNNYYYTTTTITATTANNFIRMEAAGETITFLEITIINRTTHIHRDILKCMASRTRLRAWQLLCLGSLTITCNNMLPQASYHRNLMENLKAECIAPCSDRTTFGILRTFT